MMIVPAVFPTDPDFLDRLRAYYNAGCYVACSTSPRVVHWHQPGHHNLSMCRKSYIHEFTVSHDGWVTCLSCAAKR